jgi:hypothetical protein
VSSFRNYLFIFPVFIFVIIYEILLSIINPGVHGPSGSSWGGGGGVGMAGL